MKCFNHSCQGESHKASDKECQDYSLTWQNEDKSITIAVVCDGHGGDSYFRSATGAKLAATITVEQLRQFLTDVDTSRFAELPFTATGTQETQESESELDDVMRRLFRSIYSRWRNAITEDGNRELTEWEREHVEQKYIDLLGDEDRIVKAYGCTLMAYVCTNDYWFAFHLGDGKLVMLNDQFEFSQPVPWDEKCFLNKTTSLCGKEPVKDFRFCIQGDGSFPIAVFLGSDGLDDTYGDGDKLNSFYGSIVKELASKGQEDVVNMLKEDLPKISKMGSQDDMSVAVVFDEAKIAEAAFSINEYQKSLLQQEICELQEKVDKHKELIEEIQELDKTIPTRSKLEEMLNRLHDLERQILGSRTEYDEAKRKYETSDIEKKRAEARMAEKEMAREQAQIERLQDRLEKLESFTLQNIKPYEEES